VLYRCWRYVLHYLRRYLLIDRIKQRSTGQPPDE
jgi:hypothetical protein